VRRAVLVVLSSPSSPEKEEEYHRWYDEVHLPDVLKVPGFVAARRYRLSDAQIGEAAVPGGHRFLALYEIEAEDPAQVLDALGQAAAEGRLPLSDALGMDPRPVTWLFEER
jgi:hypothetical protein